MPMLSIALCATRFYRMVSLGLLGDNAATVQSRASRAFSAHDPWSLMVEGRGSVVCDAHDDLPSENESRSNVTLQRENRGYWAEERGQVSRCEPSAVLGLFCGGGTAFETLTSTEHSARG